MDLAFKDKGDDDFISDDEDESIENSKYSYFNRKETNDKNACEQEDMEGDKQQFLCPISSCTFFLSEKNAIFESDHLQRFHPHVNTQMSFLMLE